MSACFISTFTNKCWFNALPLSKILVIWRKNERGIWKYKSCTSLLVQCQSSCAAVDVTDKKKTIFGSTCVWWLHQQEKLWGSRAAFQKTSVSRVQLLWFRIKAHHFFSRLYLLLLLQFSGVLTSLSYFSVYFHYLHVLLYPLLPTSTFLANDASTGKCYLQWKHCVEHIQWSKFQHFVVVFTLWKL